MQCKRCHHADEAHADSDNSRSILHLGACGIPDCPCPGYLDAMDSIDEDLL